MLQEQEKAENENHDFFFVLGNRNVHVGWEVVREQFY
jgi:hypothetical protein